MKIGIIGAMEKEIFLIHDALKKYKKIKINNFNIYTGIINNANLVLIESGIGKTAATICITLLIYIYKPDIIINIGSAAKLSKSLNIEDIVVSNEVRYHDVDVTAFGYNIGQIPKCPTGFFANKNLIIESENIIKKLNYNMQIGLIISGDIFINNNKIVNNLLKKFPNAIAVDMESASIGHACYKFRIPFIVIRMISDIANQVSHLIFKKNITFSAQKSLLIIEKLINRLNTER